MVGSILPNVYTTQNYNYQGLTRPFPSFVKLNPEIPDLSIPELTARVEQEKQDDKRKSVATKGN